MEIADFRGELRQDEPLSAHTSFRIGGPVDLFAVPADREDLAVLLRFLRAQGLAFFVLGGGTNLLVRDKGFRGVAISLRRLQRIAIEREYRSIGGAYTAIRAEAGALLSRLLSFSLDEGLTGLEFATGIPGTVGGAVRMNAGTAGGEMGDVIDSVTLLDPDGNQHVCDRETLAFGYRTADIADDEVVLDALLVLRRDDPEQIKARVRGLRDKRKKIQPRGLPNAGSVFKNPIEGPAGKLIEAAGMKGRSVGGARVSERHANFIVNAGRATARDVLTLMDQVQQAVRDAYGVLLEPEIRVIGEE